MCSQQALERGDVAGGDGVRGQLEPRHRGAFAIQRFDVLGKPRPALEAVVASHHQLGIGECQGRGPEFGLRQFAKARMECPDSSDGFGIA